MFCPEERRVVRNREGFTMIEVVVSSSVLVVVFVAILSSISTARRIQSLTENKLACLHIARQVIEAYSNRGYDSSNFSEGTVLLPNNRGQCVVTQVSGQKNKDVAVDIKWIEPSGMTQSVSLTSSYSRSLHR